MTRVAVLASFNMDLVMRADRRPDAGETLQGEFSMHLGGKGFNQAVAARRLGADVIVTGRVGGDEFGRMFLGALDREGIDRHAVVIDRSTGTGVATVIVEPDGANTIIQAPRANRNAARSDWTAELGTYIYDDADVPVFFAQVDLALANLETNPQTATRFFRDMCASGQSWGTMLNAAPAGDVPPDLRSLTDAIVVNAVEAAHLAGTDAPRDVQSALDVARGLRPTGAPVVVTMGERGAVALRDGSHVFVPAFDVPVVDTTGAGDAFCAALAASLQQRGLAEAVRFASAAGAIACTRHGAYESMPTLAEVEELLARGRLRAS